VKKGITTIFVIPSEVKHSEQNYPITDRKISWIRVCLYYFDIIYFIIIENIAVEKSHKKCKIIRFKMWPIMITIIHRISRRYVFQDKKFVSFIVCIGTYSALRICLLLIRPQSEYLRVILHIYLGFKYYTLTVRYI